MLSLIRACVAQSILALAVSLPLAAGAQETPPLDSPADAASTTSGPTQVTSGKNADEGTSASTTPTAGPDDEKIAREIVQRADAVRFPDESFQVEVTVESTSGGEALEPRVYRVSSKGNENTIVQTLAPANERGQNMLMRGHDLWIFMPSVSQPVRLSLSQRLTGQVANGDLARANFAGDYTPKLVGSETIEGREYHVLELAAAQRGVTYPKVKYWVQKSNMHPYKAEFYSVSGRLLKTCTYGQYKPLGDRTRPTRLVIADALKPADVSILTYGALRHVELPDRFFTKDYMKRLD